MVAFAAGEQERMQRHEQDGADQAKTGRSHGASVHRAGNQSLIAGYRLISPLDSTARSIPGMAGPRTAPPSRLSAQRMATNSWLHACSQRRQASAQTRQCSCIPA